MPDIEFRDGKRSVPDHVAEMMAGLETHKFTFEEATRLSEQKIVRDHLNSAHNNIIVRHFKDNR